MKRTILFIIFAAWLLVPTGTPDDFITFYLINKLGVQLYILVLIGLGLVMWHYKINFKKMKKGIKSIFK